MVANDIAKDLGSIMLRQKKHDGHVLRLLQVAEEYSSMGDRQKEILRYICEYRDMDFHSLAEKTGKDRVTILQSMKILEKKNLLKSIKVDPKNPKSRLVFHPTAKGLAMAISYLGVSYENHKKQYGREVVSEFESIVPGIYDASIAFRLLAGSLSSGGHVFDNDGNLKEINSEQKRGLLDYLQRVILANHILYSNDLQDVTQIDKAGLRAIADIVKNGKNIDRMFQIFREMGVKV
jgi:hypothetical protein